METAKVTITCKGHPHDIVIKGVVQKYNLQEFRKGVDPVLSVRNIPGQKGIDLYKSQVVSVDEIEGGVT